MAGDENRSIARRFVLEHNQANFRATFDDLLHADSTVHEYLPGVPPAMDRVAYEHFIEAFRAALPDIQNGVEEVIAEANSVAVRWTGTGTHTGADLMGLSAQGRRITANGVYVFHIVAGKIREVWNLWDTVSVLQQLGAGSAPG